MEAVQVSDAEAVGRGPMGRHGCEVPLVKNYVSYKRWTPQHHGCLSDQDTGLVAFATENGRLSHKKAQEDMVSTRFDWFCRFYDHHGSVVLVKNFHTGKEGDSMTLEVGKCRMADSLFARMSCLSATLGPLGGLYKRS